MEIFELRPGYRISRLIRGGWQLAGGHGPIDQKTAIADLISTYQAGIWTFDCADIYTGVEDLFGAFRQDCAKRFGAAAGQSIKIHTKFVPDLADLDRLSKSQVTTAIDRSLRRLSLERLDLVQFHWWDYALGNYLETAHWLNGLRVEGKIDLLGGTNFDSDHLVDLCAAGIPLASLQIQYSLLDDRPERSLIATAQQQGIGLLCYGTVAGGFLSNRWLNASEPPAPVENRSLTKYKLIIDEFGGWALFQKLLQTLQQIADRHRSDIASVASRFILDRPAVAGIIVGARNTSHLAANTAIAALRLTPRDRSEIAAILAHRQGPAGDVYALERARTGRHGAIMKYNLGGPVR
jgi:aryl-alcohol dehydrogenase-like predicted oxidoreductase